MPQYHDAVADITNDNIVVREIAYHKVYFPDSMTTTASLPTSELIPIVLESRARTFELVADLSNAQLLGPLLAIVNPPLWEIGHVAWFQEKWVLQHWSKRQPLIDRGDTLYDSAAVDHDIRWDLTLPSRQATFDYLEEVRDGVCARLEEHEPGAEGTYFVLLSVLHEYMHTEALTYTRQTHHYCYPQLDIEERGRERSGGERTSGDTNIPGGMFELGAPRDLPFVFDNEKWAHVVELKPFP